MSGGSAPLILKRQLNELRKRACGRTERVGAALGAATRKVSGVDDFLFFPADLVVNRLANHPTDPVEGFSAGLRDDNNLFEVRRSRERAQGCGGKGGSMAQH